MKGGLRVSTTTIPRKSFFAKPVLGVSTNKVKSLPAALTVKEPLGLVHSDVCGRMSAESLGGAGYFLTFINNKTRRVGLSIKTQVFDHFLQWKALVENPLGET